MTRQSKLGYWFTLEKKNTKLKTVRHLAREDLMSLNITNLGVTLNYNGTFGINITNTDDKGHNIQIMSGLEGDLEEWQTQEVKTSRVCHFSRSPEGPDIICFDIPNSSTFSCTY